MNERTYMPDAIGNTVALLNESATKTDTFAYWPYGEIKTRTGATDTPFRYIGVTGYYVDSATRCYVRARHLQLNYGRWFTVDPLWVSESQYMYAAGNPTTATDPSGMQPNFGGNCPEWIKEAVKLWCKRIKNNMSSDKVARINKCIAQSSRANNLQCNGVTKERLKCMQNFCNGRGTVTCDKGLYRGHTPGGQHPHNTCDPKPDIRFNPSAWQGSQPNLLTSDVPWVAHVFLHELAHACGIVHGVEMPDERLIPGWHFPVTCNDIWACCIFETLSKDGVEGRCTWPVR